VPDGVLDRIKHAARYGRVIPSLHARARMQERNAEPRDVKNAIITATTAIEQEQAAVRLEGGTDLDSVALTVVVREVQPGLYIITVL
jgi:hypothetical protein